MEEKESKSTAVTIYMSFDNVKVVFKNEYEPEKKESQKSNFIVYDLETFHTIRAVPYCVSLYQLSKIAFE